MSNDVKGYKPSYSENNALAGKRDETALNEMFNLHPIENKQPSNMHESPKKHLNLLT
jgi:hypothetical protein